MLDKNKTVLVVTGCIAPPQGVAELAVADAEARRQQYLDSLGWALHETPFTKIVYCDNSDASAPAELLAHAQATGKKLEWLHFAGRRRDALQADGAVDGGEHRPFFQAGKARQAVFLGERAQQRGGGYPLLRHAKSPI